MSPSYREHQNQVYESYKPPVNMQAKIASYKLCKTISIITIVDIVLH